MKELDADSVGIISALGMGVGTFLAVLLSFELFRRLFPSVYFYREQAATLRQWDDYDGVPIHALPRPSTSFFSWVKPVVNYSEDDFIKTHGLDAALYVRFLRMKMLLFSVLALYGLLVMIPFYSTAANRHRAAEDPLRADGIAILSLANVPANDWRLWITLSSEILVIALLCYFVRSELYVFLRRRLEYRANSARNPSNYAVLVLDVPREAQSQDRIRDFFNRCFPGQIAGVHHVRKGVALSNLKQQVVAAMKDRECAAFKVMRADFLKPEAGGHPKLELQLATALEKQRGLEEKLSEMMKNIDRSAPYTAAAIVIFNNKRTAMLAASVPLYEKAQNWRVERAAEPRAVNWDCLHVTNRTAFIRFAIVTCALTALTLLWVIPITFLQGVANIEELSKIRGFGFLADAKKSQNTNVSNTVKLVEGLVPPLILNVFAAVVPHIFRAAISQERIASYGKFESKVRTGLYGFYCVSNFFFVVLAGSFLEELQSILRDPTKVIKILATTVPSQATFIMTFVLILSFQGSPVELLNLGRLIVRPILLRIRPNTDRVRRDVAAFGFEYEYFKGYALGQMVAFIAIIYSTISPLICTCATLYFGLSYLTNKFMLMYSYHPRFEMGGSLQAGAWYSIVIALYVHLLCVTGLLGLKQAASQSTITLILFFLTLGFAVYLKQTFPRISHLGSLVNQMDADIERGVQDQVPAHFVDEYQQPALTDLDAWEAEDLTGKPHEMREKGH